MGLDMYAYKVKQKNTNTLFNFDNNEKDYEEFHYWRKHHDLHGWMENLYYKKGGNIQEFNCIPVKLDLDDLQSLKDDILNHKLPPTTGIFFGNYPPDAESDKDDLQFIEDAKAYIDQGYDVYYYSWW